MRALRERIARLEGHWGLTAGAGAGKTRTLVDTYLAQLEGGGGGEALEPEQIVAITFTDKAAAEMRSRVVARVTARAASGGEGAGRWQGLIARLEWAPIATIHSFCAALLREQGVHLGLDPDFTVLDEAAYTELLDEVIQEVLRGALAGGEEGLGRLLGSFSLGRLETVLAAVHRRLATLGLGVDQAREATARAHDQALADGHLLVERLAEGFEHLVRLCREKRINYQKGYGRSIQEFLLRFPELEGLVSRMPPPPEVVDELLALTRGNWYGANPARQVLREALEGLEGLTVLPWAARLADDLLELARRVEDGISRELGRRAALGFDQLLLRARELLRGHPRVLADLRRRWRVILVDEYQDVNPLQGELVALLAGLTHPPGYQAPPEESPPRLLVVGDPKQSIYAFRGAVVAVFGQTLARLEQAGGRVGSLPENFRSRPELVEFFNRLFPRVFALGVRRELAPEAFVTWREEDRQRPAAPALDQGGPAVEVIRTAAPEGADAAARRQAEAQALAAYLSRLLEEEGFAPGEVVVLLRRLTRVRVYEEALAAAGVDFYTVRGRGFWACPEVADLTMALRAVLDPEDHLALAATLRSPLVGLSDEALLALCRPEPERFRPLGRALAEVEEFPSWLGEEQARRWRRARELILTLHPLARRLSPAELLTWLIEAGDLIPVLLGTPGGDQALANLRKLVELARRPPAALAGGVEAFTAGLTRMLGAPPQDPQAPLAGEEAGVVRIMTIHQAKGLEFPVVVLADLASRRPAGGGLPPLGPEGVLALSPWDPGRGRSVQTTLYRTLRERSQAVEEGESARLLYVACTRACRRLAFVLSPPRSRKDKGDREPTWQELVEELVCPDPACRQVEASDLSPDRPQRPEIPALSWPELLPPEPGPRAREGAELVQGVLASPPPSLPAVRESVSGLEAWFDCPRLWFFTRRLGLDTAWLAAGEGRGAPSGSEHTPRLDPVSLGSAVHLVLERAELPAGPAGLEPVVAAVLAELGLEGEPWRREVLARAARLWDTPLGPELSRTPPRRILREQPFRLWLPGAGGAPGLELRGEWDLVLLRPGGQALIVDYKVSEDLDPDHYRHQLALYALAWSRLESDAPPPRTALCYLRRHDARLVEVPLGREEPAVYRERALAAAADMAAVGPGALAEDLPAGPGCSPSCPLAAAGLCRGRG